VLCKDPTYRLCADTIKRARLFLDAGGKPIRIARKFGGDSVGLAAFGRIHGSRNSPKQFGFSHLAIDPRRDRSPVLYQLS